MGFFDWLMKGVGFETDDNYKPKKEKKDPLEGLTQVSPKLWTDGNGNYYKKNGKKM